MSAFHLSPPILPHPPKNHKYRFFMDCDLICLCISVPPQGEPSLFIEPQKVPRDGSRIRHFSTPWNPNCAVFPRHGSRILQKFHAMESTFAPVAFRSPRDKPPPAKSSTQWKPLSAFFHTLEPCFGKFSTPWNPVSPVFPRNGRRFSTRGNPPVCKKSKHQPMSMRRDGSVSSVSTSSL